MKKDFGTTTFIALTLLVFLVAGCRREQEGSSLTDREGNKKYSVGLRLRGETDKHEMVNLKSLEEKMSYALGLVIGLDLDRQNLDLNPELLAQGFQDAYTGKTPALTDEEIEQVRKDFRSRKRAEQAQ
jgi:hypothetical protein